MALIECKECGHEFSSKAEKCPNCGNPNKKSGCGILILIVLIILVFSYLISGITPAPSETNSSSNSSHVSAKPTTANIHKTFTTLYVTNTNDFIWTNPTICINGILSGYRFKYSGSISPGEQIEIGLANFTKRNGDRFQSMQKDVTEVFISVDGHDSKIYNF